MTRTPKASGQKKTPSFESSLRRKVNQRESRQRLLVVCGALVTESDYITGLKAFVKNPAVSVRIAKLPGAPGQVVDEALRRRDQASQEYDQVWCVLDVDQFPRVREALAAAGKHGIEVALSNPCFEIWLLLHFKEHHRPAASYDALKPVIDKAAPGGYSKTAMNFRHYQDNWMLAVDRAMKLAAPGEEAEVNPSTGMWRLAVAIAGRPPEDD